MASIDRAGPGTQGSSKEVALRYAIKGAKAFTEVSQFYESRRGGGQRKVSVGTVNVEQGGKAIVGNERPRAKPGVKKGDPVGRAPG